ncbi:MULTISPECIES: hypothetical protein [unclassified Sporosarcina]|uniref:hypothetical protein n=1 Tax=unclassified Sporosarcina TaxID=2647733 RepID=UPI000AAD8C91|nr:hypothetical protein [Sporosarcina sp. ZBG7A]
MSELVKTVTFSFTSSTFEGTEARETFTFEELEIDESLDEKELGVELDRIYQAWIWDKINVSGSIVIDEPDTFQ